MTEAAAILRVPDIIDWRRTALFLDFDGTLAPIVSRPSDAAMAPETRLAVERLARACDGALALLSGRGLGDLEARLSPFAPPAAAGSHGLERREANGVRSLAADPAALAPVAGMLRDFASSEGLRLEEKPGALTLHYRDNPNTSDAARALAEKAAATDPKLRALHGHMVSEVALAGVDKGAALTAFMAAPPFAGRRPIAAGDDATDEDAFRAAQALGGFGVRIGGTETCAMYRMNTIDDFLGWLSRAAAGAVRTT